VKIAVDPRLYLCLPSNNNNNNNKHRDWIGIVYNLHHRKQMRTVLCGRRSLFITAALLLLWSMSSDNERVVVVVQGLAPPLTTTTAATTIAVTRRIAMFGGIQLAAAATVAIGVVVAESSFVPPRAVAYERRDVGDETRSAEQAAYNLQAYETNSRLERQGLKLETQAEQKASLTAALAEYTYTPATTSNSSTRKAGGDRSSSTKSSSSSSDKEVNK
jgi:hypothetical protein